MRELEDQVKHFWMLDPTVCFLNHGSFGACPIPVLERQRSLQTQLEQEPLQFLAAALEPLLDQARQELASFLGAPSDELAFVPNATTGVNTVLRSLQFQPGDHLLTTNHEYNASRNALDFVAERSGATVTVAPIPFPIESPQQVIDAVLAHLSPQTRLVLIDHITSQTALVLPLQPLVRELSARGVEVLVDGAHAPGMIPLNLTELGATYYAGNCHKWLCAPKGSGFLYVKRDRQSDIRPLVISHGANSPRTDRSRFHLEFDWVGTTDPTPYLCIPETLQFLQSLMPGGWLALSQHNRQKALAARQLLCDGLEIAPPCPESMIGGMATIPLPNGDAEPFQKELFQRFRVEVPVISWHTSPNRLLRISAQVYNRMDDYEYLLDAIQQVLTTGY